MLSLLNSHELKVKPDAALILLCAGSGSRMGASAPDKILHLVAGKPIFLHALESFRQAEIIDEIVVVSRDSRQEIKLREALGSIHTPGWMIHWARGGRRRQDSVWNGLQAVTADKQRVYIHDAARPYLVPSTLRRLAKRVMKEGNATLGRPITNTIKEVECSDSEIRLQKLKTLDRSRLWAVETPQGFQRREIIEAYRHARENGLDMTDDTSAFEHLDKAVSLLLNPDPNPKLTHPHDLAWIQYLLDSAGVESP